MGGGGDDKKADEAEGGEGSLAGAGTDNPSLAARSSAKIAR